jgi:hypothetical protein
MELYDKLDEGILKATNVAFKAYNNLTGKTKADLANKMLSVAPIIETVGMLNRNYLLFSILMPIQIFASHYSQNENKKIEEREKNALENRSIDLSSELFKNYDCRKNSFAFFIVGSPWLISHRDGANYTQNTFATDLVTAAGFGVRALSYYVMRADNLPPKKGFISRSKEKLMDYLEEVKNKPFDVFPRPAFG